MESQLLETEDKVCRFCGTNDARNINIFQHSHSLLEKILTIYPIVLYRSDPLPKHICVKCCKTISLIHGTMERILTTHNKWIEDIRLKEPNHIYLTILEAVTNSNNSSKDAIKNRFGEVMCKALINCCPMVVGKNDILPHETICSNRNSSVESTQQQLKSLKPFNIKKAKMKTESTRTTLRNPTQLDMKNCPMVFNVSFVGRNASNESLKNATVSKMKKDCLSQTIVQPLMLQDFKRNSSNDLHSSNSMDKVESKAIDKSCSITTRPKTTIQPVKSTISANKRHISVNSLPKNIRVEAVVTEKRLENSTTKIVIDKNGPSPSKVFIQEENGCATSGTQKIKLRRTGRPRRKSPTSPITTIKCRYCENKFVSEEMLATHQLIHIRLDVPKLFKKKFLPKSQRRGRLIKVKNQDCIRCLNCWCVFIDSNTILEHWAIGNCDFYCHVCLQEFPLAPKMLRDHCISMHGISYRSCRSQRIHLSNKLLEKDIKISTEASNKKTTIDQNSCPTCKKVFQNLKARNSHMRLHKASHIMKYRNKSKYSKNMNTSNTNRNIHTKSEDLRDSKSAVGEDAGKSTLMKFTHANTNSFGYVKVQLVNNLQNSNDQANTGKIPDALIKKYNGIVLKTEPIDP